MIIVHVHLQLGKDPTGRDDVPFASLPHLWMEGGHESPYPCDGDPNLRGPGLGVPKICSFALKPAAMASESSIKVVPNFWWALQGSTQLAGPYPGRRPTAHDSSIRHFLLHLWRTLLAGGRLLFHAKTKEESLPDSNSILIVIIRILVIMENKTETISCQVLIPDYMIDRFSFLINPLVISWSEQKLGHSQQAVAFLRIVNAVSVD